MGNKQSASENSDVEDNDETIEYTNPPEIFELFENAKFIDRLKFGDGPRHPVRNWSLRYSETEMRYPDPDAVVGFLKVECNKDIDFDEEFYIKRVFLPATIRKVSYTQDGSTETIYSTEQNPPCVVEVNSWASSLFIKTFGKDFAMIEMSKCELEPEDDGIDVEQNTANSEVEIIKVGEDGKVPDGYKILSVSGDSELQMGIEKFGTPEGTNIIFTSPFYPAKFNAGTELVCAKMTTDDYLGEKHSLYKYKRNLTDVEKTAETVDEKDTETVDEKDTETVAEMDSVENVRNASVFKHSFRVDSRFVRYFEISGIKNYTSISFTVFGTKIFEITPEIEICFMKNGNYIIPFCGEYNSQIPEFIFPTYSFVGGCGAGFPEYVSFVEINGAGEFDDIKVISHNINVLSFSNGLFSIRHRETHAFDNKFEIAVSKN